MPDGGSFKRLTSLRLGVAPYVELADPINNAVDRWLDRRFGAILARLPLRRWGLRARANGILALESRYAPVADQELRSEALKLRSRLLANPKDHQALSHAFALVREVSSRVTGKKHYPVQLMGALALYDGNMVEMATGEGKTITATPAAVVAALSGIPTHVVTVNDYLAARDADENRPIFDFFDLTCGVIETEMEPSARREQYDRDITYTSNSNLAFDYLRDRIALKARRGVARLRALNLFVSNVEGALLLRGLHFAIVDEADSVFVDEARTPLILSSVADDPDGDRIYHEALSLARSLKAGRDYEVDNMNKQITLEALGKDVLLERARSLQGIWRVRKAREELVTQALAALTFFENEREYIIDEEKVVIVDEFTGRVMPDRSWQAGLHQMIEAKEDLPVTGQKITLARITYQRFFRRYVKLSGMTGTGMELAGEFRDTFGLGLVRVPTHRKNLRRHVGTVFLQDETAKWNRVALVARQYHAQGRPVLIGTRSVDASERAASALSAQGLVFALLNARQDAQEAEIVARAGQPGAITVATNIAGRGTDIKLGDGVRESGGLHVILTEFHESSRIDRQLYGRAGRQGDPGTTEAIVSLTDELFRRFAPWRLRIAYALPMLPVYEWMRRGAQSRAEAEHAATRRQQTKMDKDLERQLAFTGRVE